MAAPGHSHLSFLNIRTTIQTESLRPPISGPASPTSYTDPILARTDWPCQPNLTPVSLDCSTLLIPIPTSPHRQAAPHPIRLTPTNSTSSDGPGQLHSGQIDEPLLFNLSPVDNPGLTGFLLPDEPGLPVLTSRSELSRPSPYRTDEPSHLHATLTHQFTLCSVTPPLSDYLTHVRPDLLTCPFPPCPSGSGHPDEPAHHSFALPDPTTPPPSTYIYLSPIRQPNPSSFRA